MALTKEQLIAVSATIVSSLGGYAAGKGWLTGDQLTTLTSLVPQVINVFAIGIPLVVAFIANTKKAKIATVAALPDVSKIVMTSQAAADAQPASNVVAAH